MLVATTSTIISSCGVGCAWTSFKVSGLTMINPSPLRIGVSILTSTHYIYIIICHIHIYICHMMSYVCMYVNIYICPMYMYVCTYIYISMVTRVTYTGACAYIHIICTWMYTCGYMGN